MAVPTVTEVEEFKEDLDDAEALVNGFSSVATRLGGTKESYSQLVGKITHGTITTYSAAATYTDIDEWVEESGIVYRPLPSALPIGPETFDANNWIVVQDNGNWRIRTVRDYTELRALVPANFSVDDIVLVTDNGVAGLFKVVTGSATDNGGTIITNATWNAASKHWKRVGFQERVYNAEWFGCNSTTDCGVILNSIAAEFGTDGGVVQFGAGTFLFETAVVMSRGMVIKGAGPIGAPDSTTFDCNSASSSARHFQAIGHNTIQDIEFVGRDDTKGVGLWLGAVDEYLFTGYFTVKGCAFYGLKEGINIKAVFQTKITECKIFSNTNGLRVDPPYDAGQNGGDNGYFTTVTVEKTYINQNSNFGIYMYATQGAPNIVFRDVVLEENGGAVNNYQSFFYNIQQLIFDNCYFEKTASYPAVSVQQCYTSMRECRFNATGGIDLGTGDNELKLEGVRGPKLNANGSTQKLTIINSTLAATSVYADNVYRYIADSDIGTDDHFGEIVMYRSGLKLRSNAGFTDNSSIESVSFFDVTSSATINANSSADIFTDFAATNLWSDDCCAFASFQDEYQPDILLVPTMATTNNTSFLSLRAHNLSGSNITLTSAHIVICVIKGLSANAVS